MPIILVGVLDSMARNSSFGVEGKDENTCEFVVLIEAEDWLVSAE